MAIMIKAFTFALFTCFAATAVIAADMPMASMNMSAQKPVNPADAAFAAANTKMHHDMMQPMTGDADRDFVNGMIPHHQGAVDMAKVELQYGKDPELKKFAQSIIDAQEKEIKFMQQWQTAHHK